MMILMTFWLCRSVVLVVVVLHLLLLVVVLLHLLLVAVVLLLLLAVVALPLLLEVAGLPLHLVVIALLLLLMPEIEMIYLVLFRLLIREVYEKQPLLIKVALQLEEMIEVVQLVVLEEAALVVEEAEAVE
jgi:hypothetical protein